MQSGCSAPCTSIGAKPSKSPNGRKAAGRSTMAANKRPVGKGFKQHERENLILSIDLSIYLSISSSIYMYLSIYLSIHLSVYLSVYLSICLSIYLPTYLSIYLVTIYLSIDPSIYLSVYGSIYTAYCCDTLLAPDCPASFSSTGSPTPECNHRLLKS